eukprot:TRINITY_DN8521_c0_g2_i2.p2 TRINITY_DN8521_c0_g2~~TRINITY_DN8521_c0_g2_i2.p2  ORF type:complete len:101 (-),score=6.41 TRINITY_DN8521_c0_g2_i2:183-485(-)
MSLPRCSPILRNPKPIRASPSSAPSHPHLRSNLPQSRECAWRFTMVNDEDVQLAFAAEMERELRQREEHTKIHTNKSYPSFFEVDRPCNPMIRDEMFEEV